MSMKQSPDGVDVINSSFESPTRHASSCNLVGCINQLATLFTCHGVLRCAVKDNKRDEAAITVSVPQFTMHSSRFMQFM